MPPSCYEQKKSFSNYMVLWLSAAADSFNPIHTAASLAASTELALCLPEPVETFTVAGLSSLSFKRNPRRISCETIPALNCEDSSRAMASCTCISKHKVMSPHSATYTMNRKVLSSSQIIGRFDFSRYIVFALHLDIACLDAYQKL